jgi:hypothetical protein
MKGLRADLGTVAEFAKRDREENYHKAFSMSTFKAGIFLIRSVELYNCSSLGDLR